MIGMTLTEADGAATYEVTGQMPNGRYVLNRVDRYESPFTATVSELASRFKVKATDTPKGTPEDGWAALAAADIEAQETRRRAVDAPSPEDVFAAVAAETKPKAKRT
jgi:hypothetical protein